MADYRWGVDITGYVDMDGFEPSLSVLCPHCAEGWAPKHAHYWAVVASGGTPLDARGYQSLGDYGASCEACGMPWYGWAVPEQQEAWS